MSYAKGKHSVKKNTTSKNRILKIIALGIISLFSIFIVYKEINISKSQKLELVNPQVLELSKNFIDPKDPILQKLTYLAPMHPKVYDILKKPNEYPNDLLLLASKKSETIDFVADFINHKGGNTEILPYVNNSYVKGKIPLYIQWDERWGYDKYGKDYFAINGCGPTALSMVAVGLTGNEKFTPQYIKNFSFNNGYLVEGIGTAWSLMTVGAKNFGIKGRIIPLNEYSVISNLKKGRPVIATMGPGHFTTQGHYIVLTGIDEEGKIIVNDPDSKERSSKSWDINLLLKEAKNVWAFRI